MLKLCHKNVECQQTIVKLLNLPPADGPVLFSLMQISLNAIPSSLLGNNDKTVRRGEDQLTQLEFLLEYLKNVKEHYLCWVIYYNEELSVLNVKLFR